MLFSTVSVLVCLSLFKYSEAFLDTSLAQNTRPHATVTLASPTGAPIYGTVDFRSISLTDTQVEVTIHGLDSSVPQIGHPYHIHANPIGADGNCEAAGGHLTPLGIPDSVTCNPAVPRACQEGDLSGKHGLLPGTQHTVHLVYTDNTLQFSSPQAGIIGRGLVIHDGKGGRIACGNILRAA